MNPPSGTHTFSTLPYILVYIAGIFRAPLNGTYVFSVYALSNGATAGRMTLQQSDNELCRAYVDELADSTSCCTAVVILKDILFFPLGHSIFCPYPPPPVGGVGFPARFFLSVRERSLFTGGGPVEIRKSRALKICPPPTIVSHYFCAPPPPESRALKFCPFPRGVSMMYIYFKV